MPFELITVEIYKKVKNWKYPWTLLERQKLWNKKVKMMQIVIGALGTVYEPQKDQPKSTASETLNPKTNIHSVAE